MLWGPGWGGESTAAVIYAAIMSGLTGSQSFEMKKTVLMKYNDDALI